MVCLGLEPVVVGSKVQTNPLSYSGTPKTFPIHTQKVVYIKIMKKYNGLLGIRMKDTNPYGRQVSFIIPNITG